MIKTVFVIIIAWNIFVFLIYGADKLYAKKKSQRISEKALISLAFFMGGIGALAGMRVFRHKTLKPKFRFLIPVAVILNAAIVIFFLLKDI